MYVDVFQCCFNIPPDLLFILLWFHHFASNSQRDDGQLKFNFILKMGFISNIVFALTLNIVSKSVSVSLL